MSFFTRRPGVILLAAVSALLAIILAGRPWVTGTVDDAMSGGSLQEVTGDGVVVLRFGGGCHGCGMADVTLKQGIEKTLLEKVPGVTAVRDATDHDTGEAPYIARSGTA